MKNKKLLALLICFSSLVAVGNSYAAGESDLDKLGEDFSQTSFSDSYNKKDHAEFLDNESIYEQESTIDEKSQQVDEIINDYEKASLSAEQKEEIEQINKESPVNAGDVSDLPVVYYDKSDLDELIKSNKQASNEVDGSLKLIHKENKTFLSDKEGNILSGKRDFAGKTYYFDKEEGLVKSRRVIADGGSFSASSDGELSLVSKFSPGWIDLDGRSYFFQNNGNLARGLYDTGSNRYFFDKETGAMARNEINKKGFDRIYSEQNGIAHYIGWDYSKGKLGYFNEDGTYTKGLRTIDGITYGFDENGKIFNRQYKKFGNQWYYFNKYGEASKHSGNFAKGWVGDRYYFSDGKPAEGLQKIGGVTYIFDELTKETLTNTTKVINFNRYKLDSHGRATFIGKIDTRQAVMGTRGLFKPGFSQYLNRKTPYFTQKDPRWANRRFSNGTFSGYGCGPTAMAMVLSRELHRNDIYPTNTAIDANDYENDGTEWQYFIENPRVYGLNSYDVPVNKKAFIQALETGTMVVRVGAGYFIDGGHFMVIDSYKDGYFLINDPYYSDKNTREKHTFDRLKAEVTVAWIIKK